MRNALSERELLVITHASRGFTDDMIARKLGIKVGTVNSYWIRIRGKLGHCSRTELVARFVQEQVEANHRSSTLDRRDQAGLGFGSCGNRAAEGTAQAQRQVKVRDALEQAPAN